MIRFIHCCKQNSIQLRRIPALSFSKYPTIYSRDNKDKLQHSFVGNTVLKQITTNHSCRNYSNKNEGNSEPDEPSGVRQFPRFSDKLIKPPRVFFLPLIYWFVTNSMEALKIRNQYDPDFNKNDFIEGSKRALEVVFTKLAHGRYEELDGMVENDLLHKLKEYFSHLPDEKRVKFEFDSTSHAVTQIDSVSIKTEQNRAFAYISMRNIFMVQKKDRSTEIKLEDLLEELKKSGNLPLLFINTEFTKECTKGVEDEWIVHDMNFEWSSDIGK